MRRSIIEFPTITWVYIACLCAFFAGCGKGRPAVAPVSGRVLYRGQPLTSGGVVFQPQRGWPVRGVIQPDGTFQLSTYGLHDGAAIGSHRVQIMSYETAQPGKSSSAAEAAVVGKSLIPTKYAKLDTSGIVVDVKETNEPVVFELSD